MTGNYPIRFIISWSNDECFYNFVLPSAFIPRVDTWFLCRRRYRHSVHSAGDLKRKLKRAAGRRAGRSRPARGSFIGSSAEILLRTSPIFQGQDVAIKKIVAEEKERESRTETRVQHNAALCTRI